MKPIKSTPKILFLKHFDKSIDQQWVDWAVAMLVEGFESPNLIILAGENAPFDQFELRVLTDKVFEELDLDYTDRDTVVNNYIHYLVDELFRGNINSSAFLQELADEYCNLDLPALRDFYLLHHAKLDLKYEGYQEYWKGADHNNIESVIMDYCINRRETYSKQ